MQITFGFSVSGAASSVAMASSFGLSVNNAELSFASSFGLTLNESVSASSSVLASVSFDIDSLFYSSPAIYQYGKATLPSLAGFGGDVPNDYGAGEASLPSMTSAGEGGEYIPPEQQYGYAIIPPLVSRGISIVSGGGDGSASLPGLLSKGGDRSYGIAAETLGSLTSQGAQGPGQHLANCISSAVFYSGTLGIADHIVFINAEGQIVDVITGTRAVIAEVVGSLALSETYNTLGNFIVSVDETMSVSAVYGGQKGSAPEVDGTARVWVVNLDTNASWQYDDYGFNSFFERDGKYYGVANDGIYLLEGDDDNGVGIEACVEVGKSNYGTHRKKHVPKVYAGASSDGNLLLKIWADGNEYIYEARQSSEDMQDTRFDVGRGLKGNYFNMTLLNQDGCDFDLESINFEPVVTGRKI